MVKLLQSENSTLRNKIKCTEVELNNKIKLLEVDVNNKTSHINDLNKKIYIITNRKTQQDKKMMDEEIMKILKNIFTESQLSLLLKNKKRIKWSEKDITVAFTLRYFSKRCYIYLRQELNYPLPGNLL